MKPKILLIDDEAANIPLPDIADVVRQNPQENVFGDDFKDVLHGVDVLLLDHNLKLPQKMSLQATDGASFVGHLRSWARKESVAMPPIVIYTSEDEAFANEIPEVGPAIPLGGSFIGMEARLAPALDVEWLISKDSEEAFKQIEAVASACATLREVAQDDKCSFDEIEAFLTLPERQGWAKAAKDHLRRARPPISEGLGFGAEIPRGVSPVIRWLLQRALPYPGLFLSDLQAAWTLGIPASQLNGILASESTSKWIDDLRTCVFDGPASGLFARRWWAAGIEYASWQLRIETEENGNLPNALKKLTGLEIDITAINETVVVVNEDLFENEVCEIDKAVQIYPRGWPAEASEPWASIELVKREPILQAMLDPSDKELFFQ